MEQGKATMSIKEKIEQIVAKFFSKTLFMVLETRIPGPRSHHQQYRKALVPPPIPRKQDQWFNLAVGSFKVPRETLQFCKSDAHRALVIDIMFSGNSVGETLMERWILQYSASPSSPMSTHLAEVPAIYKKTIIMLRSLYSSSRLLPAYRLFCQACDTPQTCGFGLSHRLSTYASMNLNDLRLPGTSSFQFNPVETLWGHMAVDVFYSTTAPACNFGAKMYASPQIITDYVDSPATEQVLKPEDDHRVGSLPISGISSEKMHATLPSSAPNFTPANLLDWREKWKGEFDQFQGSLQPPSPMSSVGSLGADHPFIRDGSLISDRPVDGDDPRSHFGRSASSPIKINCKQRQLHFECRTSSMPWSLWDSSENIRSKPSTSGTREIGAIRQYTRQMSHLHPDGDSSGNDRSKACFGSAPASTSTSLPHNLKTLKSFSKTLSSPLRSPRGVGKKDKEFDLAEHTSEDSFSLPFAIDNDESWHARTMNTDDTRTSKNAQVMPTKSPVGAVGELVLMLRYAAPLSQQRSISGKVYAGVDGSHLVSEKLKSTANMRTINHGLEELRGFIETRDILLRQSGRK